MKTYFRLLSFAKPFGKFATPYFIFTLFYAVFNAIVFSLLIPTLQVLFNASDKNAKQQITNLPTFDFSVQYFKDLFNYNFNQYTEMNGPKGALVFVAISLIICAFSSNLFRYLSQRMMENLRIFTLQNLRKTVF